MQKKAKAKQQQDDGAAAFRGILDGSETLIDPLSGIPIEEQEEILAQAVCLFMRVRPSA